MKCPKNEELARYLDGELPEKSKTSLRKHLLSCPDCRGRLKSMMEEDSVLRGYLHLAPGPSCPEEETIIAYAEGRLTDRDMRRISAHLAGCDYCAVRAAGALETIRLREELEKEGLEPVPGHLVERIRKRFGGRKPVSLGRIGAVLTDLQERFQHSFEFLFPEPAFSVVREPAAVYKAEQSDADETRSFDKNAPKEKVSGPRKAKKRLKHASGRVTVEISPSADGKADLLILLTDEFDHPLTGIDLQLQEGKKFIKTRQTGIRGEANFPEIRAGSYRLFLPHPEKVFLDITII